MIFGGSATEGGKIVLILRVILMPTVLMAIIEPYYMLPAPSTRQTIPLSHIVGWAPDRHVNEAKWMALGLLYATSGRPAAGKYELIENVTGICQRSLLRIATKANNGMES